MFVKIVAHAAANNAKLSGVQTSQGDCFAGDVVQLPDPEGDMLIAIGRAKEVDDPKQKAS